MITEYQNTQPSVNVYPSGNGNGGGFFGDGAMGGGWFFWIILFFFMMMFMGWGNNNGNAAGNSGAIPYAVYPPYMPYMNAQSDSATVAVRNGFDQAALVNGITGVQNAIQTGFANAEVSRCNQQANVLATLNNNQNATIAALNNQAMALQNCCCENRAATADLKYTIATENCNDRAAITEAMTALTAQNTANTNALLNTVNGGIQAIKDQLCADKIDAKNEEIANLRQRLNMAELAASQNVQTGTIQAGQRALANEIEQYVRPNPIPAYVVQNPNCCNAAYPFNGGCGCGCNS